MTDLQEILASLRQRLAAEAAKPDAPAFLSATAAWPAGDPLDWLAKEAAGSRLYWQGRDGEIIAGSGTAHLVAGKASDCADRFLELYRHAGGKLGNVRYFGGLAFDRTAVDDLWAPFDRCRFHLPETLLTRHPDGTGTATLYQVRLPSSPDPTPTTTPSLETRDATIDDWTRGVNNILADIAAGKLEKTVLAARSTLPVKADFDAFALLRELRNHAADAFVFAFEPQPGAVFLGASPERLYRREGTTISTEALAGTRRRGTTAAEDQQLATELLNSDKDRREQQFVLNELLARLTPLCDELQLGEDQPTLLPLETVQHLVQHLRGVIRPGVLDHDIIRAIHPTPAVGGRPRDAALDTIHQQETCGRGWYAAPVGWLSPTAAEFAVAIRSALHRHNKLYLYAGAGIVPGSTPAREWDEIQQKQTLLRQLVAQLNDPD